ncbi:MAG: alanine--glyoxylate aminotransferase family protein [Eubacteriales bacterium]|nr:alanine--glyoxylate aminotransferase family protein [Eubacteriales bacterium]
MYKIMTPGPTQVSENVRMARSRICTNPDLDVEFVEFYKKTCELISSLLYTKNETLILDGEGILGLEAACATLTEPGDKVLVLDNGIYGKGFADFVSLYGGIPIVYHDDYENTLDVSKLEEFLAENHDFKYATVVHCDTPSGVKNDISQICPLLKKYNILTLVDSVSAMFGEEVRVDDYQIDILCGGSQKAVSAPPGLTFVVVSDDAKKAFHNRKTPVASFYANLNIFDGYYESKWFPYTMPISDIYGLAQALENIKADKDMIKRHEKIGNATRKALVDAGLKLHLKSGFCNTVTVFDVPDNATADQILEGMKSGGIMLAGSFDFLAGKVIRIGHMGANCNVEDMRETLALLGKVLNNLGVPLKGNLEELFLENI